eukprot:scaffold10050_cov143-Isochrysis_galbana.AAC.3
MKLTWLALAGVLSTKIRRPAINCSAEYTRHVGQPSSNRLTRWRAMVAVTPSNSIKVLTKPSSTYFISRTEWRSPIVSNIRSNDDPERGLLRTKRIGFLSRSGTGAAAPLATDVSKKFSFRLCEGLSSAFGKWTSVSRELSAARLSIARVS